MTLHTFQGQSAGPVDEGQPVNAVDTIVLDPGNRQFEGNSPGTLYVGASRATTLGEQDDLLDSALYFAGPNMNQYRVLDTTLKRDKATPYKKVALRERWVQHLDEHTVKPNHDAGKIKEIKQWCKTFRMKQEELDKALSRRHWRKNMRKGINY